MADCSQSPYEFFQDAFSPQVAVLCSHDAEVLCRKNNLSFVELTQPFCRLSAEGTYVLFRLYYISNPVHSSEVGYFMLILFVRWQYVHVLL